MSKYEVIEKVIGNRHISKDDKVYFIEMFLKGWHTEEEIKWLWEE